MILYSDFNFFSPWVMSVFVCLKEKKIPFELKTINLKTKEQHQKDYANLSPSRRVPTLVDKDFTLSESNAIVEYLEDHYQSIPVLPTDLKQKAQARQIQSWFRSDLQNIRTERPADVIFGSFDLLLFSDRAKLEVEKLFHLSKRFLINHKQCLFDRWTVVDMDLAFMLNRLIVAGDEVPEQLKNYASFQWQRPSCQAWIQLSKK